MKPFQMILWIVLGIIGLIALNEYLEILQRLPGVPVLIVAVATICVGFWFVKRLQGGNGTVLDQRFKPAETYVDANGYRRCLGPNCDKVTYTDQARAEDAARYFNTQAYRRNWRPQKAYFDSRCCNWHLTTQ